MPGRSNLHAAMLLVFCTAAWTVAGCGPTEPGVGGDIAPGDGTGSESDSGVRPGEDGGDNPGDGTDGGPDGGGEPEGCRPKTCETASVQCGVISDGCGKIVDCGGCSGGATCGLYVVNQCGTPCEAKTCAQLGASGKAACGAQADGCGGTLNCGGCAVGEVCGDGQRNVCVAPIPGDETGIVCKTRAEACAQANRDCGQVSDGCSALYDCGACSVAGDTCGGGGVPYKCGQPPACVPLNCAQLGFDCGDAVDNCGNVVNCGSLNCGPDRICGGGGGNKCGAGGGSSGGNTCPAGTSTTVTGTVRTPKGQTGDPIYGALVYVPKSVSSADIPPFSTSVACERCESQVPPTAIAHAITGPDGKFTLSGVPAGTQPLVIQVGRWRRKVDITVTACVANPLSGDVTRLPRKHNEGNIYDNIPRIAVVTGSVDGLECVISKMGVDNDQFSKPWRMNGGTKVDGPGRIHIFRADTGPGASAPQMSGESNNSTQLTTPALFGTQAILNGYDMVTLGCQGSESVKLDAHIDALVNYVDNGGRVFATHFSYAWLHKKAPFKGTADWSAASSNWTSKTGTVDATFAKGQDFSDWLRNVNAASGTPATMSITDPRSSVKGVLGATRSWITLEGETPKYVEHMTFNTPVAAASEDQCGRVVFSDFHVTAGNTGSRTFPDHCTGNLTNQEKVLLFMLFDLGSCIQPDVPVPPTCTPKSCADLGVECGNAGNGCGSILNCGTCSDGLTCGGGGVGGKCGSPQCTPLTCALIGQQCGAAGDGCGGVLACGTCPGGEVCGGGGPGKCGVLVCTPATCAALGVACGQTSDGCGNLLSCGTCQGEQTCGGGGVWGQCGGGTCVPKTCADFDYECGPAADGCGKALDCGSCTLPKKCGGGGKPGKCGGLK